MIIIVICMCTSEFFLLFHSFVLLIIYILLINFLPFPVWVLSKLAINLMTRILARDHKYDERKDILITAVSITHLITNI